MSWKRTSIFYSEPKTSIPKVLSETLIFQIQILLISRLVLCQEKVQIKCNQFSLFLAKFNLQSLLHSFRAFRDIVPRIQLETNIHNDCECVLYCKMFRCIQKSIYMHACS